MLLASILPARLPSRFPPTISPQRRPPAGSPSAPPALQGFSACSAVARGTRFLQRQVRRHSRVLQLFPQFRTESVLCRSCSRRLRHAGRARRCRWLPHRLRCACALQQRGHAGLRCILLVQCAHHQSRKALLETFPIAVQLHMVALDRRRHRPAIHSGTARQPFSLNMRRATPSTISRNVGSPAASSRVRQHAPAKASCKASSATGPCPARGSFFRPSVQRNLRRRHSPRPQLFAGSPQSWRWHHFALHSRRLLWHSHHLLDQCRSTLHGSRNYSAARLRRHSRSRQVQHADVFPVRCPRFQGHQLGERYRLDLIADVFNLFNHTNIIAVNQLCDPRRAPPAPPVNRLPPPTPASSSSLSSSTGKLSTDENKRPR